VKKRQITILSVTGLGLVAVGISAFVEVIPKVIFNPSTSAPTGFYRVYEVGELRRGDLVLAHVPEHYRPLVTERNYLSKDIPLIKRVAALSGDYVCYRSGADFINGIAVAVPLETDGMGRPMPTWKGCRTLQNHEFFAVMTDVNTSLDSRYFGPLELSLVIGKLEPVWLMDQSN